MFNDDEIEECLEDKLELTYEEAWYWFQKYPENFLHYIERHQYLRDYAKRFPRVKVERERKPKSEHWTVADVERVARSCRNRREFNQKHSGLYQYAKRHGIDIDQWLPARWKRS